MIIFEKAAPMKIERLFFFFNDLNDFHSSRN